MNNDREIKSIVMFGLIMLMLGVMVSCCGSADKAYKNETATPLMPDSPIETIASVAGISPDAGVGRADVKRDAVDVINVTATAYCPCVECCGKDDGITASGTKAKEGRTIAVDPTIISYGTKVEIGGNTYYAEDTGGAIKGNRIDVFFYSHEEALEFGVQELTIKVFK